MSIHPRQGKSGTVYRVFVYDPEKKKSVPIGTFHTRGEAEEVEENAKAKVNVNEFIAPSRLTVAEFIEQSWLPAVRLRTTTGADPCEYHAQRIVLGKGEFTGLGPIKLQKLTAERITRFYQDMLLGGLSHRYVHHISSSLTDMLNLALKHRAVTRNEALAATRPPKSGERDDNEDIAIWQSDELRTLFEYLHGDWLHQKRLRGFSIEDRLCQARAWYVQATTGLRREEILGLRWSDIDFAKSELRVRWVFPPRKGGMANAGLRKPKSKHSRRTVALFPETVAMLKEHRLAWQRYSPNEGEYEGLVFCKQDGGPVNPATYTTRLYSACIQAHVSVLGPHAFRHTHATTLLRDMGWDIYRVKERLGHSSVTITEVYLHFVTQDQHDAIKRSGTFLELGGESYEQRR